ncbi:septum formation initiator family protein [Pseudomonadota bacterium]
MGIVREFKVRAGQIAGPVVGMTVVAYFAYHAVQGDRGLIALGQLRQDVDAFQAQVLDVRAERMNLERKVYTLRADSLDPDMLEERARLLLGYGFSDEQLVITEPPQLSRAVAGRE